MKKLILLMAACSLLVSCKKETKNYYCYCCNAHHGKCDSKCDSDKCHVRGCKCSCNVVTNWRFLP
jgi:hypothetical protein